MIAAPMANNLLLLRPKKIENVTQFFQLFLYSGKKYVTLHQINC